MIDRGEAKLGLAIVGLGRGAVLTAPGLLAHERIRLIAGCDPSPEARAAFTEAAGAPAHAALTRLLEDGSIDALYIASPHEFHAQHAIAAAQSGKHVLVEKPMAIGLAEAAAMVEAAKAAGVVLMVGPSHGYDPPVALAAALANRYGGARLVHAFKFSDFLYRPRRPAELDRALGGGVVFSQASHHIDLVRRIAAAPVRSVRGWVGDWDPARRADGAYSALLSFANGAAASITYSGYARYDSDALAGWIGEMGAEKQADTHRRTRAALAGASEAGAKRARGFAAGLAPTPAHHESFGHVLVCCPDADLELTPDGVNVHDETGVTFHRADAPGPPRRHVADAFVRAVLDGETATIEGQWGLTTLACCHAIVASSEAQRDVSPDDLIKDLA
jgi:phthalate 4,5-cis-dihydrodiol dehydrogenase